MKHGEDRQVWREGQREKWESGDYESPLCCQMMAGGAGWATRHIIDGFPPEDCPLWCWAAVGDFMTWRGWQTLPYGGGFKEQPARLMSAFRILGSAMAEIEESRRKVEEWQRGGK